MQLKLDMSCHPLNVYTKFQIDIPKHVEEKSGKCGRTYGHCHGIIRPFFKRAYKNKEIFSSVQHRYLAVIGWGWLQSKHIRYRADLKKCSIYLTYSVVYIYVVLYHYRIQNVPKTVLSRVLDQQPPLQNKNEKQQKNCNHLSYLG